jgi:hypothetical protein
MEQPSPPTSLPKYLAECLPKQDTETLQEIHSYVEALIEYRDQSVDTNTLPETAEPVDKPDSGATKPSSKRRSPVATIAVSVPTGTPRYARAVSLPLLS